MATSVHSRTQSGVDAFVGELMPPSWEALTQDTGVSVLVLDAKATILYANVRALAELKLPMQEVLGKCYCDFFAPEFAAERLGYFQRVAETGTPIVIDHTFGGCRRRTSVRPFSPDASGTPRLLMVCRPAFDHDPAEVTNAEMVRAKNNDLGALSSLTPRELEILYLIGQGLATADIAKQLHRSEKTVEWHRVSLGNKLGVSNRVELARIAIRCGLLAAVPRVRAASK
jgi:DNA-binding CsgD family transcriptional regulator